MAKPSISTNRRQLLFGTGALAAMAATSLDTTAWSGPDPAYLLYLRVVRTDDAPNNLTGDEESDDYRMLFDTLIAAERKLAATPATSLMGVWGKMTRIADGQCWKPGDDYLESCLGLSLLADINRMAAATVPGWSIETPESGSR